MTIDLVRSPREVRFVAVDEWPDYAVKGRLILRRRVWNGARFRRLFMFWSA